MADVEGIAESIGPIVTYLRDKARSDPKLREALRAAAKVLLDVAAESPTTTTAATQPPPAPVVAAPAAAPATPAPAAPASPARPMPGRDAPAPLIPVPVVRPPVTLPPVPAPVVQTRLRLGDAVRAVAVVGTPEEARAAAEIADRSAAARRTPSAAETAHPPYSPPQQPAHAGGPPDLSLVVRRCKVKAAACRYVAERPRLAAANAEAAKEKERELYTQAKSLPDCYLWVMAPHGPSLPPEEALRGMAENYETLAAAADLMAAVATAETSREPGDPWSDSWFEDAMRLLAESQSALRVALSAADRTLTDHDQNEAFQWLRWYSRERQIYISRFMRLDDGADPSAWQELRDRIAAFRQGVEGRQQRDRLRRQLTNKARYHAQRVVGADGSPSIEDWTKLLAAVEELVAKGVPPSDADLRDVLRPLADQMPEELAVGPGVEKVLREIDRYLGQLAASAENGQAAERERRESPEVKRAAELLAGRRVVLIGGACRPHAKQALERALGLSELDWISTSPHESLSVFEPSVARPDTALVLLAIRWSSHSFGEVKALADHYGKAFVRLPAGYNPQQVAVQVLAQASGALESLPGGAAAATAS